MYKQLKITKYDLNINISEDKNFSNTLYIYTLIYNLIS